MQLIMVLMLAVAEGHSIDERGCAVDGVSMWLASGGRDDSGLLGLRVRDSSLRLDEHREKIRAHPRLAELKLACLQTGDRIPRLAMLMLTSDQAYAWYPASACRTSFQQRRGMVAPQAVRNLGTTISSLKLQKTRRVGRAQQLSQPLQENGLLDFPLLFIIMISGLANYHYNIGNKLALKATGGAAGIPLTIATLQLAPGALWALWLWIAPDGRERPALSLKDVASTMPTTATTALAHVSTTVAVAAGSASFAQIVKCAEPAFAAIIGTLFYGSRLSIAKWITLIPVVGGVGLASLGELDLAWGSLLAACLANVFAALKGSENKKLMSMPGLNERIRSVGNQFGMTIVSSFLFLLPLALLCEGRKLREFLPFMKSDPMLVLNIVSSGLWWSIYNEFNVVTIKKTSAVTSSVTNTAKRAVVILVVALVMKESLTPLKLIGSSIGIFGVLLYAVIDRLVESRRQARNW